ncbi:unnamed protein product [Cylicocyclus nassatus]|uniref:PH domain-containing protein n=1 Tax=Cylicocyclus nassatus TaxID=53992 RepID=A0AA36GEK6_CYLNA|nr:unnamed protein product [Cylicocyclus nassatus]
MARGRRGCGRREYNDSFGENTHEMNDNYFYREERPNHRGRGRYDNRGGARGNSFRERNDSNWHARDSWHGGRRSGYAGFSTGSFGVMGDADSVNRSATESPEIRINDVPLASVEDLAYNSGDQQISGSLAVCNTPNVSGPDPPVMESSSTGIGTVNLCTVSDTGIENTNDIHTAKECVQDEQTDGGCEGQKLSAEKRTGGDMIEHGLVVGHRIRSMSYHAMDNKDIPKFAQRSYRSSVIIDGKLGQTLTSHRANTCRSMHLATSHMGEDAANFGITVQKFTLPPASSDVTTAIEKSSHDGRRSTASESEADMAQFGEENDSARRFRSVSQCVLGKAKDSGDTMHEGAVGSQCSVSRTFEGENDGLVRDEEAQIRSVRNDAHYNNHRLSKLSIHTNNDEFFYVGGHPPSDGRTSLRSRGSMSRQSMRSTDFLAGGNEWTESVPRSASRQSIKSVNDDVCDNELREEDDNYEDAAEGDQCLEQQTITSLHNIRSCTGSTTTSPDYVTASERITSPDRVSETVEMNANIVDGYETDEVKSASTLHKSDAAVNQSASNISYKTAIPAEIRNAPDGKITSCRNCQEVTEDQQRRTSHTTALHYIKPYRPYASELELSSAQHLADRQSTASAFNVAYEEDAGSFAASSTLLKTAQSTSRQNMHSNAFHKASEEPQTKSFVSNASLHPSNPMIARSAQSTSRSSIHGTVSNTACGGIGQEIRVSRATLTSNPSLATPSASRQSVCSNASDACGDRLSQNDHMSISNLQALNPMALKTAQSTSRQSIHANGADEVGDEVLSRERLPSAYSSNPMLCRTAQSTSRQSIHANASNEVGDKFSSRDSLNANLYCSNPMLVKTAQSTSRQSIHASAANTAESRSLLEDYISGDNDACSRLVQEREQIITGQRSRPNLSNVSVQQSQEISEPNPSLHASNTTLMRDAKRLSRQRLVSDTDLHASEPFLETAQSVSRQSIHSSALCHDFEESSEIQSSHVSLHASNPTLTRIAQRSRESVRSSASNSIYGLSPRIGSGSNVNVHSLHEQSASRLSSVSHNNVASDVSNAVTTANANLRASNPILLSTAQSDSRHSIEINAACREKGLTYTSDAGLYTSNPAIVIQSASQQSLNSNSNTDIPSNNPHSLDFGGVSQWTTQSSLHQNMGSSKCSVACDEDVQLLCKSSDIHTSVSTSGSCNVFNAQPAPPASLFSENENPVNPETKTARSASRQSMRIGSSVAVSDHCNDENPQSLRMSRVSLKAPSISSLKTAQSTSRHSIRSNSDVAYDERPTMLCASDASLNKSNTRLPRSAPFSSEQNLANSDLAHTDSAQQVEASIAVLHASNPALTTALSTSEGDLNSNVPVVASRTTSEIIPANEPPENPPLRIGVATSSPLTRSLSCCSAISHSDFNNNSDTMLTARYPSSADIVQEDVVDAAPRPTIRRSLQAIPTALSRTSSRASVHEAQGMPNDDVQVFEGAGGGLWYHFNDERRRASATSTIHPPRSEELVINAHGSETTHIPPKKPPRSRSSSATRNEVHFSSIPQLLSHPDDRFGVEMSGEPYRSSSEHELTPHAQKTGSKLSVATAVAAENVPYNAEVDVQSGMMTVPTRRSSVPEIITAGNDPPSRTPSLKSVDIVPSPLVVTDALTPKRAPYELKDGEVYDSPASFNRTLFTRDAFLRRRYREPERAEVGIQTGETIRLRQKMSFEEGPTTVIETVTSTCVAPLQPNHASSEKSDASMGRMEHVAAPMLNAMLQQRQMHAEYNSTGNAFASETLNKPDSAQVGEIRLRGREIPYNRSQRRSFIDNQHHQYETRTHKTWKSNTRSQYEEGKFDENCNELRNDWEQADARNTNVYVLQRQKTLSECSDQVFEETVKQKKFQGPTDSETAIVFEKQAEVIVDPKLRQNVNQSVLSNDAQHIGAAVSKSSGMPVAAYNVIPKRTAEELRQKVLAESRSPSKPKTERTFGFDNRCAQSEADRVSLSNVATRNSAVTNDLSYVQPSRISMNMPNSSSLYSPTSTRWPKGSSIDRSEQGSPYRWQVPGIDIHKEYREPDARSNDSKLSSTGSTVRRHVPRGRIRDLARLFDRMTRQAEKEAAVLRGKSVQPPKHRFKFRTRSMPRQQDLRREEEDDEDRKQVETPNVEEPSGYKLAQPDINYNQMLSTGQQEPMNIRKPSSGDAPETPTANRWSKMLVAGLAPGMMHPVNDEAASTDSRLDLRRTSTPMHNRGDGDLAKAFGRVPSIHSPETSALYEGKPVESEYVASTNNEDQPENINAGQFSEKLDVNREPSEHHYAKPMIVKPNLPPQRMSVIHPNNGQHGYYVQQHRRNYSEQLYRGTDQVDGEPIYARVQRINTNHYQSQAPQQDVYPARSGNSASADRAFSEEEKVNGEIDRMFDFVEQEQDGLSTIGHRTVSERTSAIVKTDAYGNAQGESHNQLPELPPYPPRPAAPLHVVDPAASQHSSQPIKYSMGGFRDISRTHRYGYIPSDVPPRFSPMTAPTAGIGVSTYKSREGAVGEKVNTYSQFARNTTHPSALATSTPVDSPVGTGFSQKNSGVPIFDDSFISAITTGSRPNNAHEEYKRQMTKLNNQIRVQEEQIEMTLKVLALARKKQKCMQELSAQRTLLLARERLDLLRCEVSRISALAAVRNPPPPVSRELRGTMTISNICVYLNRSFCQRQYEQESSYALLILLKCGSEVEATGPVSLLAHTQNRVRQLTFAENVQFSNLPVDFNVVLEVYAMKLPNMKNVEQSCASNIANKCKNLLSPALVHRSNRPTYQDGSEFIRCGYIILNRDTVGLNKFYLDEAEYPLEGTIEVFCRCTTLPPAIEVENRGFLAMYQTVSDMGAWERYWAVLRRGMVYFWRYPNDESMEKRPVAFMDLSKCTNDVVAACTPEQCPRENSFSIDMLVSTTPSMMEKKRVLLSADSEELLQAWLQALNETLELQSPFTS